MYTYRNIQTKHKVKLTQQTNIHKAGFILKAGHASAYDPFLIMAEDIFQKEAFGFHPHRGMETVTYVIDGELHHKDNHGGEGILHPGDAQWMTAGKGLIHLEAPPTGETVHTLQLWVNLPKAHKMAPPRYQDILNENVPERQEEDVIYRVFSGNSGTVISSTKNYVPVTMVEMLIPKDSRALQDIPADYNGFLYVLEGKGTFGKNKAIGEKGEILWLDSADKDQENNMVEIKADEKLRVLFFAGKPLKEPVVARGPFVMNTEEELDRAFKDYRAGKF